MANIQVKDGNNVSGTNRVTCPFYDEMDAILGNRAASAPPVLLQSSSSSQENGNNILKFTNLTKYFLFSDQGNSVTPTSETPEPGSCMLSTI